MRFCPPETFSDFSLSGTRVVNLFARFRAHLWVKKSWDMIDANRVCGLFKKLHEPCNIVFTRICRDECELADGHPVLGGQGSAAHHVFPAGRPLSSDPREKRRGNSRNGGGRYCKVSKPDKQPKDKGRHGPTGKAPKLHKRLAG